MEWPNEWQTRGKTILTAEKHHPRLDAGVVRRRRSVDARLESAGRIEAQIRLCIVYERREVDSPFALFAFISNRPALKGTSKIYDTERFYAHFLSTLNCGSVLDICSKAWANTVDRQIDECRLRDWVTVLSTR